MSSAAARDVEILVLEPSPWWLPELQRKLPGMTVAPLSDPVAAASNRLDPQMPRRLRILVLEGPWLHRHVGDCRRIVEGDVDHLRIVAVLGDEEAAWEWPLRELGVSAVVTDHDGGMHLEQACRRLAGD